MGSRGLFLAEMMPFYGRNAVGAMVLHDPALDLLFERIQLGGPRRTRFADDRLGVRQVCAHGRAGNLPFLRNLLHRLPLVVSIVYRVHCLTPEHRGSPEVVFLIFLSVPPSWGSIHFIPAQFYPSLIPARSETKQPGRHTTGRISKSNPRQRVFARTRRES